LGVSKEIKITTTMLREMLVEAYQSGWYGIQELDGDTADSIIDKHITEDMLVKATPPPLLNTVPFVGVHPLIVGGLGFNYQQSSNLNWPAPNNVVITADTNGQLQISGNTDHSI
jgi:hypothetical protein